MNLKNDEFVGWQGLLLFQDPFLEVESLTLTENNLHFVPCCSVHCKVFTVHVLSNSEKAQCNLLLVHPVPCCSINCKVFTVHVLSRIRKKLNATCCLYTLYHVAVLTAKFSLCMYSLEFGKSSMQLAACTPCTMLQY